MTDGVILRKSRAIGQTWCRPERREAQSLSRALLGMTIALLFALTPQKLNAHEIPSSVIVRVIVRQESSRVRVLVRAPLAAMRDIDFPLRPGTGFIDFRRADALLPQAATVWLLEPIDVLENGEPLTGRLATVRASLDSDRAFSSVDSAEAHLRSPPLDPRLDAAPAGVVLDAAVDYPTRAGDAVYAIHPALARLGVRTTIVLTIVDREGRERKFEYQGDPGTVRLNPRWYHAVGAFISLGMTHIWSGIDHLLFLICLVLPFRKLKPLIGIVTAFTVAHSITLVASSLGMAPDTLWFPPLVEVLVALSIVYMALDNILLAARGEPARTTRRWMTAFGFGLVHGFAFSFGLRESLQFSGSHLALSLVSFNIGVEIGQVAVLVFAVPVIGLLYERVLTEKPGNIIISALVAHTAWHWLGDRWSTLAKYDFDWSFRAMMPALRVLFAAALLALLALGITRSLRLRGSRVPGDAV